MSPYPARKSRPHPERRSDAIEEVIWIYYPSIMGNLCDKANHLFPADAWLINKLIITPHGTGGVLYFDDAVEDKSTVFPLIEDNLIFLQDVRKGTEDYHIAP